jgi:hypothetical protein
MTKSEEKMKMCSLSTQIESLHRDRRAVVIGAEKGLTAAPGYSLAEIDARLRDLESRYDDAHLASMTHAQRQDWLDTQRLEKFRRLPRTAEHVSLAVCDPYWMIRMEAVMDGYDALTEVQQTSLAQDSHTQVRSRLAFERTRRSTSADA